MRQAECKSDQIFLEEVIDNIEHCFYLVRFGHGCFPIYYTKMKISILQVNLSLHVFCHFTERAISQYDHSSLVVFNHENSITSSTNFDIFDICTQF
jgi:hypothetical protein